MPDFVVGVAVLVIAALLLAKVAVLPGLVVAGVAAMFIFQAVAWLDGERLTRRVLLHQTPKILSSSEARERF